MWRPIAALLLVLGACSKPDPSSGAPSASSSAIIAAEVDAAPPVAKATTWTGAYKSSAGTLYVPPGKEWSGTKWRGDESPDGLGEGTITLSIDPKSGGVAGTLDGPVGPGVLYGSSADGKVTATLARKDAADNGFTGTLIGNVAGDKLEGTMHVSSWDAHTIRAITFSLGKK
ncbi:MAG: hypothetical protein ABIP89_11360 [Polyangiaceae bacterium]